MEWMVCVVGGTQCCSAEELGWGERSLGARLGGFQEPDVHHYWRCPPDECFHDLCWSVSCIKSEVH